MSMSTLQAILATMSVQVHAFAFCEIQNGWRLEKRGVPDALIVHYILAGSGTIQAGDRPPVAFGPHSIVIPPRNLAHTIGFADASRMLPAADGLGLLPNGLLRITAGDGSRDILLACGAITARYAGALGLFDRLQDAVVGDLSASKHLRHAFSFMVEELAEPGLGTADVTGALMKRCLVFFLRLHLQDQGMYSPLFRALRDPRLAGAVAAIVDAPAAPHTVESLAALCGMSRTAFAERFSDTFGEGPIAFLQRARLRLAAQVLVTSPMPVKVIAASVGYASRSHFSHAFRAAYGIDPTAFRRRRAEADLDLEPLDAVNHPVSPGG
ncbi:helix-turn-helix domain-containing protein [Lichenibacterium dinghuense]|uniref:helix-turn-helix domain-containing protein n=1 Tax=Lichenibacterium dinghuense TaxID=2895977 RepID=UPI001F24819A|nr:AraC family transcriptional regulator [Lichenibacterium sp. 6Y81]